MSKTTSSQPKNPTTPPTTLQTAPPLLLCEALGFSPQLLLDDIINIANNAVQDGINGMEQFLNNWADARVSKAESSASASDADKAEALEATTHEVEQGLVAFQTLLEHHTDIAFDFFEAWCLRNIFMIPKGLPVVLPHQEGLDLTLTGEQAVEREAELRDEVERLRERLDGERKLNRLLHRSIHTAERQATRSKTRLSSLSALSTPLPILSTLPDSLKAMHEHLSTLPPTSELSLLSPSSTSGSSLTQQQQGKRQWETSKAGYMNWALRQLMVRNDGEEREMVGGGTGTAAVDRLVRSAEEMGSAGDMKAMVGKLEEVREGQEGDDRMEE
ncbi:Mis12 protein-domain-containing protein [Panaeolus papilionaceus]|nr:Mis12 protein-domain-containing protein [Panaeolus papilionaceus]